jgi:hypothetical protein
LFFYSREKEMAVRVAGKYVLPVLFLTVFLVALGCSSTPARPEGAGEAEQAPAVEDAAGDGEHGERRFTGPGEEELGGVISKADFQEFASIGKSVAEARKLYVEYFYRKEKGTVDTAVLGRAIAMYEQLFPRLEILLDKYPVNAEVQRQFQQVANDLRSLKFEK